MPYELGTYVDRYKGYEIVFYLKDQDPKYGRVIGHMHLENDAEIVVNELNVGEHAIAKAAAINISVHNG